MKDVISALILGVFIGVIVALLVVTRVAMAEPKYTPAPADHMGVFNLPPPKPTDNVLGVYTNGIEAARITYDGRVYLHGKEVHTRSRVSRGHDGALAKGMNGCKP